LLELQFNVLLSVVLLGMMVADNWRDSPMFNDTLVELIVTPVIGMLFLFTVTVQVAVLPFDVVTVIVAVPGLTAVTNPL